MLVLAGTASRCFNRRTDVKPFSQALDFLAQTPVLLVASDYDGTLAPIVTDPDRAFPIGEVLVALKTLATLPQTHAAIISGRALRDLAALTGSPRQVHLVGSHGSEFDIGFGESLGETEQETLRKVRAALEKIADETPGVLLEHKPAGLACHYRNVDPEQQSSVVERVLEGPSQFDDVTTRHGKKVIELAVVSTDKGQALATIRSRVGASAVIYFGDDLTDEDAFQLLQGPDVGIKVGDGETAAQYRVDNPDEVARLLARLTERRAAWLAGESAAPIESHAFLTDQRTAALVQPNAKINWFCPPRLDSASIFAELVGGVTAGHFSIVPLDGDPTSDAAEPRQRYLDDSFHVETTLGRLRVIDFLDTSAGRPQQRAGRTDLLRRIEGEGRVRIEFAPRLDYGRLATRLKVHPDGLEVLDTIDPIVLRSPGINWKLVEEGPHQTAVAETEVEADQALTLELRFGTASLRASSVSYQSRSSQSQDYWQHWASGLELPELEPEFVKRSALVIKGLIYGPTGGIAAAATTSLPEHIGGVRNWDYRYCWIRDGALCAETLALLGSVSEGIQFLDWLLGVLDTHHAPEQLRPLYSLTGQELGPEAEIGELSGYAGSRPVRIGNGASRQIQLDVFGFVVQLIDTLLRRGAPLSSEHWRLVSSFVQAVEHRWREPDHGIWEVRGPRRHFVHSKVMCWLAVDRAIDIAAQLTQRRAPAEWLRLRDAIATEVTELGYKPAVNSFVTAYDGTDFDASALWIGLAGLIAPDDSRFVNTVHAIDKYLRDGPTVYRYRFDDGLPGREGGFHICTSWLIDAWVAIGEPERARSLFQELIQLGGPTALLPEQYDPVEARSLGNHPQAYSHLGLIRNALHLTQGFPLVAPH